MPCCRGGFPADLGSTTRAIVVTFGGGVRWEDTFAPQAWGNIPHLAYDLLPQGLFYPEARYDGLTAHFGAYSLYLEAIRRTDRLVLGLWQHAQSLPAYRDRTVLIVVPEMGRDGDESGNGFQNHRSGDESCRRLWMLVVRAGGPRGLVAERTVRTLDVAPTLARVLGFEMPPGEGRALHELPF